MENLGLLPMNMRKEDLQVMLQVYAYAPSQFAWQIGWRRRLVKPERTSSARTDPIQTVTVCGYQNRYQAWSVQLQSLFAAQISCLGRFYGSGLQVLVCVPWLQMILVIDLILPRNRLGNGWGSVTMY